MLFANYNLQIIFKGEIDISINNVFRLTYFIDSIRLNMGEREMHTIMNYYFFGNYIENLIITTNDYSLIYAT